MATAAIGLAVIGAAAIGGVSRRFTIVDGSMRPTFEPDDWVIARRHRGVPARGHVVVFTHSSYPGWTLIKRVVGLPGEHVTISNGQIHIDGHVLAEPWADRPTATNAEEMVPDGTVWVMADRRAVSSIDSRVLGAIPIADVEWKVVARYWPPPRAGRVDS